MSHQSHIFKNSFSMFIFESRILLEQNRPMCYNRLMFRDTRTWTVYENYSTNVYVWFIRNVLISSVYIVSDVCSLLIVPCYPSFSDMFSALFSVVSVLCPMFSAICSLLLFPCAPYPGYIQYSARSGYHIYATDTHYV